MADGSTAPAYSMADFTRRWAEVKARSAALVGPSLADRFALAELDEPGFIDRALTDIGPEQTLALAYDSDFWARPKQKAPLGEWLIHLHIQGRGGGKTWKGSTWIVDRIERGARQIVLVGPNIDDIRQFMVGGNERRVDGGNGSGLLDVLPPWIRYEYRKDDGVIEFPDHHCIVYLHSAEVPEFRGPNPDSVLGDEIIKWRYPERLLSNLRLACRAVGRLTPQMMLITSPKKKQLLRDLVMEEDVVTYHGRTDENRGNVHERWFLAETKRLGGTPQGDEELDGELLGDNEEDLFPMGPIDHNRAASIADIGPMDRIVVAIDPSGSVRRTSDTVGISAAGRVGDVHTGKAIILEDVSGRHSWDRWAEVAIETAEKIGASAIVVEINKWGNTSIVGNLRHAGMRKGYESKPRPGFKHLVDLVHTKTGRTIQIVEINAKEDKATRAKPVSTMYKKDRVVHVGHFPELEAEMNTFDPTAKSGSPNRMDALVHALTELFVLDALAKLDPRKEIMDSAAANDAMDRVAARSPNVQTLRHDPSEDVDDYYSSGSDRSI